MRYCATSTLALLSFGLAGCLGGGGGAGGTNPPGSTPGSTVSDDQTSGSDQQAEEQQTASDTGSNWPQFTTIANAEDFEDSEYFRSGALDPVNASALYAVGGTGAGVTVAIVDTGIDTDHAQLAGRIDPASTNIVTGNPADVEDGSYHGTLVAGIIAAERDGSGVQGLAYESELLAIRADTPGSCPAACSFSQASLADATDYAVAQGAKVINYSLGGATSLTTTLAEAMANAADAGSVLVFAAGNTGGDNPTFPGAFASDSAAQERAIVVGAVDGSGNIASYSNRAGTTQDFFIVAPGSNIETTFPGGGHAVTSGTSLAAPIVSGAAAALWSAAPSLTAEQVVEILLITADDLGAAGVDPVYGWGLLNLETAISPIGSTDVPTSFSVDGPGVAVANSGMVMSGALAGGSLPHATVMMLDAYDRAFGVDLAGFTSQGDSRVDMEQVLARRDLRSDSRQVHGRQMSLSGYALDSDEQQLRIEQQLGNGMSIAAFIDEQGRLGEIVGEESMDADLVRFADAGHAFSGFASQSGFTLRQVASGGMFFGLTAGQSGGLLDEDGENASLIAAVAGMDHGALGRIGLRVGQLEQQGAMLGTRGEGLFAMGGSQNTSFVELSAERDITAHFGLFARAAIGLSEGERATAESPVAFDDFWSSSWAFGMHHRDTLKTGDRLTFAVSQPLRAENAAVNTNLPVARTLEGDVVRERRKQNLENAGREIDLEMAYTTPLSETENLGVNLMLRQEPGHDAGADPELLTLFNYRLRF